MDTVTPLSLLTVPLSLVRFEDACEMIRNIDVYDWQNRSFFLGLFPEMAPLLTTTTSWGLLEWTRFVAPNQTEHLAISLPWPGRPGYRIGWRGTVCPTCHEVKTLDGPIEYARPLVFCACPS